MKQFMGDSEKSGLTEIQGSYSHREPLSPQRDYNIAMGFAGLPVPRAIFNGSAMNMNS